MQIRLWSPGKSSEGLKNYLLRNAASLHIMQLLHIVQLHELTREFEHYLRSATSTETFLRCMILQGSPKDVVAIICYTYIARCFMWETWMFSFLPFFLSLKIRAPS